MQGWMHHCQVCWWYQTGRCCWLLRDKRPCRGICVSWSTWQLSSIKLKMTSCWILYLGQINNSNKSKWEEESLERSPAEGDLGLLAGRELNLSQCAWAVQRANCILECIKHNFTSWENGVTILLYLELMWPHFESYVWFWSLPFKRDVKILECIQRKVTKLPLMEQNGSGRSTLNFTVG